MSDVKPKSSYDASSMPRGLDKELERLRTQALLTWEKEARNLRWMGLREDMSVLELGSGPGFVTEQLVNLVPLGRVVALELDPVLIERATRYLKGQGLSRWTIVHGDIVNMGFADNTFDFAYARYLFQHLPDPVGAAREVLRVLRPGGTLAICDVDDDLNVFDPPAPPEAKAIGDRVMKDFQEKQASKGGNRLVGRRLPNILKAAGFVNLQHDALVAHSLLDDLEGLIPRPTREMYQDVIARGVITEAEADLFIADVEEFERSDHVIQFVLLISSGQKPE